MKTIYLISQHGIIEVDYEAFLKYCATLYYPGYTLTQVEHWILNYKFIVRDLRLTFFKGSKFYNTVSNSFYQLDKDFTRGSTTYTVVLPGIVYQINEEKKSGIYDG